MSVLCCEKEYLNFPQVCGEDRVYLQPPKARSHLCDRLREDWKLFEFISHANKMGRTGASLFEDSALEKWLFSDYKNNAA